MLDSMRFAAAGAILAATLGSAAASQTPEIPADTEIQTTASGLKYSVLQQGDGSARPKLSDTVRVHYTGWLEDGTPFDSSRQRGEPAEFPVNGVIAGWTEGLQLMSPGARFKLTIPPELGYGASGAGSKIPPNATLIFDVELLAITKEGPPLPEFRPLDPEQSQTTEAGLRYQIIEEGEGEPVKASDALCLDWAMWTPEGQLVECSSLGDKPICARIERIQVPFFADLPPLLKPGTKLLCHVSAERGMRHPKLAPESDSVWMLEVRHVFDTPAFVLPPDEELTKTESGLAYQVLREGKGDQPSATDQVMCHYAGWLTDGTPFDASYERGQASSFAVSKVIKGWTEGLQLMREGAKYLFVIPSDLGYGARGHSKIPPGSDLVFVVELIEVQ